MRRGSLRALSLTFWPNARMIEGRSSFVRATEHSNSARLVFFTDSHRFQRGPIPSASGRTGIMSSVPSKRLPFIWPHLPHARWRQSTQNLVNSLVAVRDSSATLRGDGAGQSPLAPCLIFETND